MGRIGAWGAAAAGPVIGAACSGGTVRVGSGGSTGASSSAASTGSTGAGGAGASSSAASAASTGAGGAVSPACAAAIAAIGKETGIAGGSCTGVVRLDYGSFGILGYQIVCGGYAHPSEAAARATAQQDTGYGQSGADLTGPGAEDELVFMVPAGDFGGSAAVSARNAKSVFGGTTVWGGQGDITYPPTWRPASDIDLGCAAQIPPPSGRGFDLGSGQPLSAAQVSAAIAPVWQTALPAGMWENNYVFDEVVLLYPRTVGVFDPATAEWLVLVNGGWLE